MKVSLFGKSCKSSFYDRRHVMNLIAWLILFTQGNRITSFQQTVMIYSVPGIILFAATTKLHNKLSTKHVSTIARQQNLFENILFCCVCFICMSFECGEWAGKAIAKRSQVSCVTFMAVSSFCRVAMTCFQLMSFRTHWMSDFSTDDVTFLLVR